AAILFIETSGCLPMCGHGTIGTVTIAIEHELIFPREKGILQLEVPAGLVTAHYTMKEGKVKSVRIRNVKSYLAATHMEVISSRLGLLYVDVAYGGNFYAIIDPQKNFSGLQDFSAEQLIGLSRELRKNLNEKYVFVHPEDSTISGI